MKKCASILVIDRPGTLLRILLVFKQLDYNIGSLSSGRLPNSDLFRISIEYEGKALQDAFLFKKISDQVNVLEAVELPIDLTVWSELKLVRVKVPNKRVKEEVSRLVGQYQGEIIEKHPNHYIISATGDEGFIKELQEIAVIEEIARSGKVALQKNNTKGGRSYP